MPSSVTSAGLHPGWSLRQPLRGQQKPLDKASGASSSRFLYATGRLNWGDPTYVDRF